jgi:crotonobetainyl-CoA:carnitine CoA-transferase CaiB-like acyl-CoA transferase
MPDRQGGPRISAYHDIRIVDFTQGMVGPMAAMLLADFDAQVVKVEPPQGDRLKAHPGYLAWNRNKQILTLDLASPDGRAAAERLIAGADVALFDHAPSRLAALGLDGQTLTGAHPALIHAWLPAYGTTGAWSEMPAHHSLLAALTGMAFRQGAWGDQPIHYILPIAHSAQAVLGAASIGAALLERSRSGRGQAVTVSGLQGAGEVGPPVRVESLAPLPRGIPPGSNPRYRLYEAGDGQWFFLGALFTNFYRRAFEALDLGDAFDAMEADMLAARDLLEGIFLSRPRDEWLALLRAHDVPCGPIGRREAWFSGDTVRQAGLRLEFDHPALGRVAMPAPPARLSETPARVRGLPQPISALPAWPAKTAPLPSVSPRGGPLAGVKVLNLGTVIAGAYAGAILANLGADVIKVEGREADPFRSDGSQFLGYNRGSRGLGLDLKQPDAQALFLELARSADVVIDNYRLGVRGRLGIDYPALKAVNPGIISCSITAYGDTGPRAALPGFDPLLQAEGGMMAAQGGADDPILYTPAVNDVATASVVTFSVIAALNARARTGQGQEIISSLMAQSLLFQLPELVTYDGRPPNDQGGRDCLGLRALHRYYACADGWLGLVCDTDGHAAAVGRILDIDLGPSALTADRDGDLARRLESALAGRKRDEVLAALLAESVACAPVLRFDEALSSDWLSANRWLDAWTHPRLGPAVSARAYADFSRTPAAFVHPTPDLGQHSAQVLADFGVAPERIKALLASGAVFHG